MASSELLSKRARAELEDCASFESRTHAHEEADVQEAPTTSLERLPGDLLSRILQLLPLKEAFRVRKVSRALRDAVEGTAFDGAKLDLDAMWTCTEKLDILEELVRDGRLKGSDLSVSIMREWKPSSIGAQPLRLVAALAGRCRSVRIIVNSSQLQHSGEHIFSQRVAHVLGALAPGGAASPLQELELLSTEYELCNRRAVLEIPAGLLAPFAGLRTLLLPDLPLSVGTAAAIAARLPALRCLQFFYRKEQRGVLRPLAPLCLERLILHTAPRQGDNPGLRLDELSGTPLGRSLRKLHVEEVEASHSHTSSFSADDLHTLAGMPELEAVTGYVCLKEDIGGAVSRGLENLLRAPRLSVLQLALVGHDSTAALNAALVAALAAGPLPSRLALDVRVFWIDLKRIVNAGAGPILRCVDVDLHDFDANVCADVFAALLRCPRLEGLVIRALVRGVEDAARFAAGLAPLAALPPLPGGLRLEVVGREGVAARARAALSSALRIPAAALAIGFG
eukprot:tig00001007_g6237.t1